LDKLLRQIAGKLLAKYTVHSTTSQAVQQLNAVLQLPQPRCWLAGYGKSANISREGTKRFNIRKLRSAG
jgi:hypothetical protein